MSSKVGDARIQRRSIDKEIDALQRGLVPGEMAHLRSNALALTWWWRVNEGILYCGFDELGEQG